MLGREGVRDGKCFSVVPLQHLLLPITITALLLVCRLKYNVDVSRHVSEPSQSGLVAAFSLGNFKPLGNKSTKATTPEASAEEMQNVNPEESNKVAGVYSCPQDGCECIFQRVPALESTCHPRNAHGHLRDIL